MLRLHGGLRGSGLHGVDGEQHEDEEREDEPRATTEEFPAED